MLLFAWLSFIYQWSHYSPFNTNKLKHVFFRRAEWSQSVGRAEKKKGENAAEVIELLDSDDTQSSPDGTCNTGAESVAREGMNLMYSRYWLATICLVSYA